MSESVPPLSPSRSDNRIVVVAASARAISASLQRLGLIPVPCDLFHDRDLIGRERGIRLRTLTDPAPIDRLGNFPILPGGGIEHHFDLITGWHAAGRWLGSDPRVIRSVRDPRTVQQIAEAAGAKPLTIRCGDPPHPNDETESRAIRWLRKPLAGAGGIGVRVLPPNDFDVEPGTYLQEQSNGVVCGAAFLVSSTTECELLGVCEALESPSGHPEPFLYTGEIGPIEVPASSERILRRIGQRCARIGLRGVFGVDVAIESDSSTEPSVRVLEINPRFPASFETLEATGHSVTERHLRIFGIDVLRSIGDSSSSAPVHARRVMYAERDMIAPDPTGLFPELTADGEAAVTDLPPMGDQIPHGAPLWTVRASGASRVECLARLEDRAGQLRELIKHCGSQRH